VGSDSAPMYSYAGASATAATVTPFTDPPTTTDSEGLLSQPAAILQTLASSVSSSGQSSLSGFASTVPTALQSLASIATSSNPLQGLLSALQSFAGLQTLSSISADVELIPKLVLPANDVMISIIMPLAIAGRALSIAPVAGSEALGGLSAGLASTTHVAGAAGLGAAAVSAGVGRAGFVGALSVPPNWAAATPTIRLAASVLQSTGVGAAPAAVVDGSGSLFGGMALAGTAGSALGAAAPSAVTAAVANVGRPAVDKENKTPEKLKRALAEMSQTPESVQHWHTDEAHLESLPAQLSKKPGMHAMHLKKGTPRSPKAQSSEPQSDCATGRAGRCG
jgi:PPE-repeat protein